MRLSALGIVCSALLTTTAAWGAVISEDEFEEESLEAGIVARGFSFVLGGDVLAPPYNTEDASPASLSVFDLRGYASYRTPELKLVLHQSATNTLRSHRSLGPFALGRGATPPRLLPLRAAADAGPTLDLTTETDWAYVALSKHVVTLTLGRQPVTFGRGRLFRPWDIVSSFVLTEVDTEYKPGVDAVRVDIDLSSKLSVTVLGAAGELEQDADWRAESRGSSLLARAKVGWQPGEISLLGGVVRNDVVFGWNSFWDLDDLELYGELSATLLRDHSLSAPSAAEREVPVIRALLGATLRPLDKLTIIPELYYDGFGARDPEDYIPVALSRRVSLGEQTVLGKLYAGTALDFEAHPLLHLTALSLWNALDGSALTSLGARYDIAANADVLVGAYFPVGQRPDAGAIPSPNSEFGLYPYLGYMELSLVL